MSKREIASLAIKLIGVFLVITCLGYLPMFFLSLGGLFDGSGFWAQILLVLGSLASLVFGIMVIVFSDKIAAWLIREDNVCVATGVGAMTKDDVMLIAFTCIGLYIAVTAFPQLLYALSNFIRFPVFERQNFSGGFRSARSLTALIAPIVKLCLGVWLFVGSRGVVRLWHKIRS